jgi:hypothetical protein
MAQSIQKILKCRDALKILSENGEVFSSFEREVIFPDLLEKIENDIKLIECENVKNEGRF